MTDLLRNPKDPLRATGPERQMDLLRACGQVASGHTTDDVVAVAFSLAVNVIRQTCTTRQQAERRYDELAARYKGFLLDHYDATGRKRGIFPYDQIITPRPIKG